MNSKFPFDYFTMPYPRDARDLKEMQAALRELQAQEKSEKPPETEKRPAPPVTSTTGGTFSNPEFPYSFTMTSYSELLSKPTIWKVPI